MNADLELMERLADAARLETAPRFRAALAVADKSGGGAFDPVTDADREAERAIRAILAAERPEDGVLGEEFGAAPGTSGRVWILDPVDGTRAFVCGAPVWTTLIGLEIGERPVAGLIDQPFTDERWIGSPEGALLSRGGLRAPARVSGVAAVADARIACTDPRADGYFSLEEASAFERLAAAARLARFGLDAYAFGALASGHLDIVVDAGLKAWDAAGPTAVVEAAGGVVSDWTGAPFDAAAGGRLVASASVALHEKAIRILSGV